MTNRVGFVIVKTQLPEKIGFCARAIKNFGFKKLDIINPKEKWPNKKQSQHLLGRMIFLRKQKFILILKLPL